MKKLNRVQHVVSEISGYNAYSDESGAQNDSYYDSEDKFLWIAENYGEGTYSGCDVNEELDLSEAIKVYYFLNREFKGENERYFDFCDLKGRSRD